MRNEFNRAPGNGASAAVVVVVSVVLFFVCRSSSLGASTGESPTPR